MRQSPHGPRGARQGSPHAQVAQPLPLGRQLRRQAGRVRARRPGPEVGEHRLPHALRRVPAARRPGGEEVGGGLHRDRVVAQLRPQARQGPGQRGAGPCRRQRGRRRQHGQGDPAVDHLRLPALVQPPGPLQGVLPPLGRHLAHQGHQAAAVRRRRAAPPAGGALRRLGDPRPRPPRLPSGGRRGGRRGLRWPVPEEALLEAADAGGVERELLARQGRQVAQVPLRHQQLALGRDRDVEPDGAPHRDDVPGERCVSVRTLRPLPRGGAQRTRERPAQPATHRPPARMPVSRNPASRARAATLWAAARLTHSSARMKGSNLNVTGPFSAAAGSAK